MAGASSNDWAAEAVLYTEGGVRLPQPEGEEPLVAMVCRETRRAHEDSRMIAGRIVALACLLSFVACAGAKAPPRSWLLGKSFPEVRERP